MYFLSALCAEEAVLLNITSPLINDLTITARDPKVLVKRPNAITELMERMNQDCLYKNDKFIPRTTSNPYAPHSRRYDYQNSDP